MKRLKTIPVSVSEMNAILKRNCLKKVHFRQIDEYDHIYNSMYIDDRQVTLSVAVNHYGVVGNYICRKDDCEITQSINGADAYIQLSREFSKECGYKIPKWNIDESAQPLLMYRESYNNKRVEAIGYDVNKAYSAGLRQPMPDTRKLVGEKRFVKDGEIGFFVELLPVPKGFHMYQRYSLQMAKVGNYAQWIFPEMESPFIKFSERWGQRANEAETKAEKRKCKDMINFSVGYLQRVNPFLRATVISHCNDFILSKIDDNTIYCNTDCIVSLTERNDLKISEEVGDFKIEHKGQFAHVGFNTQWNEEVSFRGIPKSWFKQGYDILSGELPDNGNTWDFDPYKLRLVKRKEI